MASLIEHNTAAWIWRSSPWKRKELWTTGRDRREVGNWGRKWQRWSTGGFAARDLEYFSWEIVQRSACLRSSFSNIQGAAMWKGEGTCFIKVLRAEWGPKSEVNSTLWGSKPGIQKLELARLWAGVRKRWVLLPRGWDLIKQLLFQFEYSKASKVHVHFSLY